MTDPFFVGVGLGAAFVSGMLFTATMHSVSGLSDMDNPSDAAINAAGSVLMACLAVGVVLI